MFEEKYLGLLQKNCIPYILIGDYLKDHQKTLLSNIISNCVLVTFLKDDWVMAVELFKRENINNMIIIDEQYRLHQNLKAYLDLKVVD